MTAEFAQETGSAQDISVGYDGIYLSFKKNDAYIDKNSFKDEPMSDLQLSQRGEDEAGVYL